MTIYFEGVTVLDLFRKMTFAFLGTAYVRLHHMGQTAGDWNSGKSQVSVGHPGMTDI